MVDKLGSVSPCPPTPWLCCGLDDGSLHSQCGTGSRADLVLKELLSFFNPAGGSLKDKNNVSLFQVTQNSPQIK